MTTKQAVLFAAIVLPLGFGVSYLFAVAGAPQQVWLMETLGLLP